MHYHFELYFSEKPLESDIEKVMEAIKDMGKYGLWDWYQIGGRWTGIHGGYDPEQDPRNIEMCHLCDGTGYRMDSLGKMERQRVPSYTCNGCGDFNDAKWTHGKLGKGQRLKWPTQWIQSPVEIQSLENISNDLTCYHLIVDNKVYGDIDGFNDEPVKVKEKLNELNIQSGWLVTIDAHN